MRTHRLVPAFAVSVAVILGVPSSARAGGCPTCTTNAECEAVIGPPAFCVLHTGDVGCGADRQICCPGQGCDVQAGRPSCETAGTCSVVGGTASSSASGGVGSSSVGGSSSVAGASSTAGVVSSSAGQGSSSTSGGDDSSGPCACARLPVDGPAWPAAVVVGLFGARALVRRRRC